MIGWIKKATLCLLSSEFVWEKNVAASQKCADSIEFIELLTSGQNKKKKKKTFTDPTEGKFT